MVDGTISEVNAGSKLYFIVSEVMYGLRKAEFELTSAADLKAKIDQIAQQIGDAQVSVEIASDGRVSLTSRVVAPIAVKPLTVPRVAGVTTFIGLRGEPGQKATPKWQPLDCATPSACALQFDPFLDLVRASPPPIGVDD